MSEVHHLSLWRHDALPPRRVTMAEIAQRVAEKHRIEVGDLKGQSRKRYIAWPRQEAMHEMHAATSQSLPAIGRFLGGRDHTTVLHGVRRHQARVDQAMETSNG